MSGFRTLKEESEVQYETLCKDSLRIQRLKDLNT